MSFFNNLFVPTAAGHLIHDNLMYKSSGAGLNIGSVSCAVGTAIPELLGGGTCTTGYSPTQDCYVIGNTAWDNSALPPATGPVHKKGISSNGPAIGIVLAHNADNQGIDSGTTLTKLEGGLVIVDPLFRMNLAGVAKASPVPVAPGTITTCPVLAQY